MKNIKKQMQLGLVSLMAALLVSVTIPFTSGVYAAPADPGGGSPASSCKTSTFGFPAWYKGVLDADCNVKIDNLNDTWVIVMNLIELLLQVVAYVAAGFVVWGGFKYIKSEGDPARISEAKAAILNAIVGLVIALGSVAIVAYIQGRFTQ